MNLYDNSRIRRQDRLLEERSALRILWKGEFGVLSMVEHRESETAGYGIPVNFVWDGNRAIYIHCAPAGHKLTCIDDNPAVSMCVVGRTNVIPHKFTTAYESLIVRGKICRGLSAEERINALDLFLDKYSPDDKLIGKKYTEKSFHRTEVLRFDIESISGKAKQVML